MTFVGSNPTVSANEENMRKRICDYAVEVLRETDNPAVGWGDAGLIHLIAGRAGLEHKAWKTEEQVLNALTRTPGELVPRRFTGRRGRSCRVFYLPEEV